MPGDNFANREMSAATWWVLLGLAFDLVGVIVLGFGTLRAAAADFRARGNPPSHYRGLVKIPVWLARRFGPTGPGTGEITVVETLNATFWGLLLIAIGFVLQGIGTLLR